MLISHKHKFIIIDIPKTATKSIRRALNPLKVLDVIGPPVYKNKEYDFKHHCNIQETIIGFDKRNWSLNEYVKYTTVRNPWDRYFSLLKYYNMNKEQYRINKNKLTEPQKKQAERSVNMFLNKSKTEVLEYLIDRFPSHIDYLEDKNQKLVVDNIGRFENLQNDFNNFCELVKIPPRVLSHSNKSTKMSESKEEVYTQELIDMVAEKEKWVIDAFNYTFD